MKFWTGLEQSLKANPEAAAAATIVALLLSVLATAVAAAAGGLGGLAGAPDLRIVDVSGPGSPYAQGAYADVRVAVDNGGGGAARGCAVEGYGHVLFSDEIDESSALGRSERFDLGAGEGRVASVGIHLPGVSGEASPGGGVRGPIFLRAECEGAESEEYGQVLVVEAPEA
jgi:hypothetical protein